MNVKILSLAAIVAAANLATYGQAANGIDETVLHGTVNVILADGQNLVAATDSMLSRGNSRSSGIKLYKIDNRTVATMANFYEQSGPTNDNSLTASVPQMMVDFSKRASSMEHLPFSMKAQYLFSEIKFKLDRHLDTMMATDTHFRFNDPGLMIELTMAGYDVDNTLKIAEITMEPQLKGTSVEYVSRTRPVGRFTPVCAFTGGVQKLPEPHADRRIVSDNGPILHIVLKTFFCEVAGLRDVPEQMLQSPELFPADAALQTFAHAQSEGKPLSVDELRALTVDLVQQTADSERRNGRRLVGGQIEVAVLTNGHVVEEPSPVPPSEKGTLLEGNLFRLGSLTCRSGLMPLGPNGNMIRTDAGTQEVQAKLTNCTQELDGMIFLNSTFTNSHLIYSGKKPLFFPDTNVIVDTTLELGLDAVTNRPDIRHLVCGFQWKSVSQRGRSLEIDCSK